MSTIAPEISIIIPTKNRVDILLTSMAKLMEAARDVAVEVIIVNDGEEDIADKFADPVVVIGNEGSGVAAARNTGAKHASAKVILFMDDDMWLTRESLIRMLQVHRTDDLIALNVNWVYPETLTSRLAGSNFGRYLNHYGFTSLKGWFGKTDVWREKPFVTEGITSQNLSMRKSTFLKSGGYNEVFPMAGFEDHDYSHRLNKQGIKILVDPTVMMFHNESDRIFVGDWLDRKVRGSITRRVAVDLGYHELQLNYGGLKRMVLIGVGALRPAIIRAIDTKLLKRLKRLDGISFALINLLLAEAIFRGYTLGGMKDGNKTSNVLR